MLTFLRQVVESVSVYKDGGLELVFAHGLRLSLLVVPVLLACAQATVPGAAAHAVPVDYDPAPDSVVDQLPDHVTVLFNEDPARGTSIAVTDANGTDVTANRTGWTEYKATVAQPRS